MTVPCVKSVRSTTSNSLRLVPSVRSSPRKRLASPSGRLPQTDRALRHWFGVFHQFHTEDDPAAARPRNMVCAAIAVAGEVAAVLTAIGASPAPPPTRAPSGQQAWYCRAADLFRRADRTPQPAHVRGQSLPTTSGHRAVCAHLHRSRRAEGCER